MELVSIVTIATSVGGMFVAFASLLTSVITYQSTLPRIKLTMWFGYEHNLDFNKPTGAGIYIQIQNLGTRPVVITAIGGDYDRRFVKWFKRKVMKKPTTSLMWTDAYRMLNDGQGGFRVFSDGQFKRDFFKITPSTKAKNGQNAFLTIKNFWVCDADDKYYFLSRKALRKLKDELNKYLDANAKEEANET